MRLYDTRSRRVEEVLPSPGRALRMHTCGPAVHHRPRLGDLRPHLLADLIRRAAERHGARVVVCRSVADIGDPGRDRDAARRHEEAFGADMEALNIRPCEFAPRATESVDLAIELIAGLIEKGHAYRAADGSVFFDAASFPSYGEISGNRLDRLRPGHRGEAAEPAKRFHADWALWRRSDGGEVWDSPWGSGLPAPNVVCTAMALRHLGGRVDVRVGGIESCFPYHEDERAQSNAATGHEAVGHWVHSGRLRFAGYDTDGPGERPPALAEVSAAGLDPLAVRLALMEHRYRREVTLTWDVLRAADETLRRWRARVAEWAESPSRPMSTGHAARVRAAFDDDLDTPLALRVLRELERDESASPGARFETFIDADLLLALDLSRDIGKTSPPLPPGAAELLDRRARARDARDWTAADRLRDELAALGVRVADTPGGQVAASVRDRP